MHYFLIIVQFVSIILLIIETGYVFSRMSTRVHAYLFFNCLVTLVNNAGYLFQLTASSEKVYMAALKMSYLGRAWVPFSLFVFTLAVCKVKIPNIILIIMSIYHGLTYLLVLTCDYNSLYYKSWEYITDGALFPYVKCDYGWWHHIYSVIMLVYIVLGVGMLINMVYKEKNSIEKKRLVVVLSAVIVESMGFMINLTKVTGAYDSTVMGYAIGSAIMLIAIYKYKLLETLQIVKDYVVDELSEAILAVNEYGQTEYYNKPAEAILKRRSLSERECLNEMEKALENGVPLRLDGKIYSPQIKPLYHGGVEKGKLYVLTDDTNHYLYMEELKAQKEIAEKANASKSAFVSIVSHEIRTPMNAVVGMTDIMLEDKKNLNDDQIRYLKNIKSSGAALTMIVNDILDQSKIEAGKMGLIEKPYNIRDVLSDVEMIIENRVMDKPIKVTVDIAENVPQFLVGDSLRIRQVVINLMNNSVKFTKEGFVSLNVRLVECNERAKIRFIISDSGQGIRPKDLFKIGVPYTQMNSKGNYGVEGTGLGLSISKSFIEMMGSNLEVSSICGEGSEFSFAIWQDIASAKDLEEIEDNRIKEVKDFVAPDAKILVVDDTHINLVIVEELLAPIGMDIETAASGNEAIELAKDKVYDLIFMDYKMPQMDGVEATTILRQNGVTAPIIAMSGDTSEDTKNLFTKAGVSDFVDKPVNVNELKAALYKWLDKSKIK